MVISKKDLWAEWLPGDNLQLFRKVKQEISQGYRLLTHPLTGSITPDIIPYKSVILTDGKGDEVTESLDIIEKSIEFTMNLISYRKKPKWDQQSLNDFQMIDLNFINIFLETMQNG